MKPRIIKGNLIFTPDSSKFRVMPQSYLYSEDGTTIQAVFEKELPVALRHIPVEDYGDNILIPGMTDLHLHAPQYSFRGFAMDLELMDWLAGYTFPEEEKYADLEYARCAYDIFVEDLKHSFTTRACIFGTIHQEATLLLMDKLEASGLCTRVGKVNQDRNSSEGLQEISAEASLEETRAWLEACGGYENTQPILTPRFLPACTDRLMQGLADLKQEYGLPLQSHLSENPQEIRWVESLCPDSSSYARAYEKRGALAETGTSVLAHCVYSGPEERDVLRETGTFVAHCPQSNWNLSSGIAPVRRFLEEGLNVGLGTDIAAGAHLSMLRCVTDAVQASKLYWRMADPACRPLSCAEAFYLATKGGGAFFGKVGSFQPGYDLDLLALSDDRLPHPQPLNLEQRLERMLYLADDRNLIGKYVKGRKMI